MTKKLSEISKFIPCCYEEFSDEEKKLVMTTSKALGNEARLEIYRFLKEVNSCMTSQLVEYLPLAQSTISQHIKVLKAANIIVGEIDGPSVNYCIDHKHMKRYYKLLGKMI